jgi:hypothetical protein
MRKQLTLDTFVREVEDEAKDAGKRIRGRSSLLRHTRQALAELSAIEDEVRGGKATPPA